MCSPWAPSFSGANPADHRPWVAERSSLPYSPVCFLKRTCASRPPKRGTTVPTCEPLPSACELPAALSSALSAPSLGILEGFCLSNFPFERLMC